MEVIRVNSGRLLKNFIDLTNDIYKEDKNYVPYMRRDLYKTLSKLVLREKNYSALIVKENNKCVARVLFNIAKNKQRPEYGECGFFALYESINNRQVSDMMLDAMVRELKNRGIKYVEGTFFYHDQENRRGILINEFDAPPIIMTSYNPPYYKDLLEGYGFKKSIDLLSYRMNLDKFDSERYIKVNERIQKMNGIYIKSYTNTEEEIFAVERIMRESSTDVNYQDAPSIDLIRRVAKELKSFINFNFVKTAYRIKDNRPVAFVMAVPDFNQVFIKMQGKLNLRTLFVAMHARKKINAMRGMLQYVIPEYQSKGVLACLYAEMFKTAKESQIESFEAGTIVEQNEQSNNSIVDAGGSLYRIYRLYGKEI